MNAYYKPRDVTNLSSKRCPCCGGAVFRRSRRGIDRLTSLIRPVRRYQCLSLECGWVGNLPRDHVQHDRVPRGMSAPYKTASHSRF